MLSGASEELYQFAHKIDAPVADSLMEKELFREQMNCTLECLGCMEQNIEFWS